MKNLFIASFIAFQMTSLVSHAASTGAKVLTAWCETIPADEKVVMWLITDKGQFRGSPSFGSSGRERMFNCANNVNGVNKALTKYRLKGGLSSETPATVMAAWCETIPADEKVVMWLLTDQGNFRGSPSFGVGGEERMFNCNNDANGLNKAIMSYQKKQ